MQYVLTDEEYSQLVSEKNFRIALSEAKLQKLCTKICDTMPVKWGWNNYDGRDDPKPWGCILSTKREWYCDTCPVTEICPYPNKSWSK